jgi:hypothetical protein
VSDSFGRLWVWGPFEVGVIYLLLSCRNNSGLGPEGEIKRLKT